MTWDRVGARHGPTLECVKELLAEAGLRERCPSCGSPWSNAWSTHMGTTVARLICTRGHDHRQDLGAEGLLSFELTMQPDALLSRSMWIEGEHSPVSTGPVMRLRPHQAAIGRLVGINGRQYVVTAVEVDRVWLRPVDEPPKPPGAGSLVPVRT
jgi:hypothetical protein